MPTPAPPDSDLGFPAKGSLKRVPFAFLVRDIARTRSTGNLYLLAGETKKVVFFVDGRPTSVRSNLATEFLGQILTDQGLITQEQCDNTLEAIRRTGKKQGELLVEMGILSEGNLRYGLEEQVRIKLYEIFGWDEGRFQFKQSGEPGMPATGMSLEIPVEALIIAGVQERWNDERARTMLKPLAERYPAMHPRWATDATGLDLLPEEAYFLRCLDGSRTVDELLARKYDPEVPQVSTLLFGLIGSGAVEAGETKQSRRLPPPRPNLAPPNIADDTLAPKFEQLSAITEYEDTPLPNKLPGGAGISSSRNPRVPILPSEDEEMFRGLDVDESVIADSRAMQRAIGERTAKPVVAAVVRAPEPTPLDEETDFGDLGGGDDDDETDFSDLVHTRRPNGEVPAEVPRQNSVADSGKSVLPQPPLKAESGRSPQPQAPTAESSRSPVPQPDAPRPMPRAETSKSPVTQPTPSLRPTLGAALPGRPTLTPTPTPAPVDEPPPLAEPEHDPLADLDADDDLALGDDLDDIDVLDSDTELDDDLLGGLDDDDDALGDGLDDPLTESGLALLPPADAYEGETLGDSSLTALPEDSGMLPGDGLELGESAIIALPTLDDGDPEPLGADDGLGDDEELGDLDEDLEIEDLDLDGASDDLLDDDDGEGEGFGEDEPDDGYRRNHEDTDGGYKQQAVETAGALAATRYAQAAEAMREGEFDQAVALFEDAYANGHDVADLHAHLAFARFRASGNDPSTAAGALELLDWAEQADPGLPMIHAYRGAILVGLGRQAEADECFDRALYLDPENELAIAYTRGE